MIKIIFPLLLVVSLSGCGALPSLGNNGSQATITALEAALNESQPAATPSQPAVASLATAEATAEATAAATSAPPTAAPPPAGATAAAPPPAATSAATSVVVEGPTPISAPVQVAAQPESPPALLLILDASGSMLEDAGTGARKIDAAKAVLNTVIDSLPDAAPVGLRVYGHTVPNTDKANGCNDTALIVPIGPLDRAGMQAAITGFEAKGWTPIATTLEQAAADLPPEGKRTIVLVSDGEETCDRDPCAVAASLAQQGVDLHIETVGFQVNDAAKQQLQCIADATGGSYYDAGSTEALQSSLQEITRVALDPCVHPGTPVAGSDRFGNAPLLQTGFYLDSTAANETRYYGVELADGQQLRASVLLRGDAGLPADLGTLELRLYGPTRDASDADFDTSNEGRADAVLAVQSKIVGKGTEPGSYYLELATADGSGELSGVAYDVEITIEVLDGATGLPADRPLPVPQCSVGSSDAVRGGVGFGDAPLLQSGQYSDIVAPNETRYYAVELADGQSLRATFSLRNETTEAILDDTPLNPDIVTYWFTPARIGKLGKFDVRPGDRALISLTAQTDAVGSDDALVPGRYFVSFALDGTTDAARSYPVEVVIDVIDS